MGWSDIRDLGREAAERRRTTESLAQARAARGESERAYLTDTSKATLNVSKVPSFMDIASTENKRVLKGAENVAGSQNYANMVHTNTFTPSPTQPVYETPLHLKRNSAGEIVSEPITNDIGLLDDETYYGINKMEPAVEDSMSATSSMEAMEHPSAGQGRATPAVEAVAKEVLPSTDFTPYEEDNFVSEEFKPGSNGTRPTDEIAKLALQTALNDRATAMTQYPANRVLRHALLVDAEGEPEVQNTQPGKNPKYEFDIQNPGHVRDIRDAAANKLKGLDREMIDFLVHEDAETGRVNPRFIEKTYGIPTEALDLQKTLAGIVASSDPNTHVFPQAAKDLVESKYKDFIDVPRATLTSSASSAHNITPISDYRFQELYDASNDFNKAVSAEGHQKALKRIDDILREDAELNHYHGVSAGKKEPGSQSSLYKSAKEAATSYGELQGDEEAIEKAHAAAAGGEFLDTHNLPTSGNSGKLDDSKEYHVQAKATLKARQTGAEFADQAYNSIPEKTFPQMQKVAQMGYELGQKFASSVASSEGRKMFTPKELAKTRTIEEAYHTAIAGNMSTALDPGIVKEIIATDAYNKPEEIRKLTMPLVADEASRNVLKEVMRDLGQEDTSIIDGLAKTDLGFSGSYGVINNFGTRNSLNNLTHLRIATYNDLIASLSASEALKFVKNDASSMGTLAKQLDLQGVDPRHTLAALDLKYHDELQRAFETAEESNGLASKLFDLIDRQESSERSSKYSTLSGTAGGVQDYARDLQNSVFGHVQAAKAPHQYGLIYYGLKLLNPDGVIKRMTGTERFPIPENDELLLKQNRHSLYAKLGIPEQDYAMADKTLLSGIACSDAAMINKAPNAENYGVEVKSQINGLEESRFASRTLPNDIRIPDALLESVKLPFIEGTDNIRATTSLTNFFNGSTRENPLFQPLSMRLVDAVHPEMYSAGKYAAGGVDTMGSREALNAQYRNVLTRAGVKPEDMPSFVAAREYGANTGWLAELQGSTEHAQTPASTASAIRTATGMNTAARQLGVNDFLEQKPGAYETHKTNVGNVNNLINPNIVENPTAVFNRFLEEHPEVVANMEADLGAMPKETIYPGSDESAIKQFLAYNRIDEEPGNLQAPVIGHRPGTLPSIEQHIKNLDADLSDTISKVDQQKKASDMQNNFIDYAARNQFIAKHPEFAKMSAEEISTVMTEHPEYKEELNNSIQNAANQLHAVRTWEPMQKELAKSRNQEEYESNRADYLANRTGTAEQLGKIAKHFGIGSDKELHDLAFNNPEFSTSKVTNDRFAAAKALMSSGVTDNLDLAYQKGHLTPVDARERAVIKGSHRDLINFDPELSRKEIGIPFRAAKNMYKKELLTLAKIKPAEYGWVKDALFKNVDEDATDARLHSLLVDMTKKAEVGFHRSPGLLDLSGRKFKPVIYDPVKPGFHSMEELDKARKYDQFGVHGAHLHVMNADFDGDAAIVYPLHGKYSVLSKLGDHSVEEHIENPELHEDVDEYAEPEQEQTVEVPGTEPAPIPKIAPTRTNMTNLAVLADKAFNKLKRNNDGLAQYMEDSRNASTLKVHPSDETAAPVNVYNRSYGEKLNKALLEHDLDTRVLKSGMPEAIEQQLQNGQTMFTPGEHDGKLPVQESVKNKELYSNLMKELIQYPEDYAEDKTLGPVVAGADEYALQGYEDYFRQVANNYQSEQLHDPTLAKKYRGSSFKERVDRRKGAFDPEKVESYTLKDMSRLVSHMDKRVQKEFNNIVNERRFEYISNALQQGFEKGTEMKDVSTATGAPGLQMRSVDKTEDFEPLATSTPSTKAIKKFVDDTAYAKNITINLDKYLQDISPTKDGSDLVHNELVTHTLPIVIALRKARGLSTRIATSEVPYPDAGYKGQRDVNPYTVPIRYLDAKAGINTPSKNIPARSLNGKAPLIPERRKGNDRQSLQNRLNKYESAYHGMLEDLEDEEADNIENIKGGASNLYKRMRLEAANMLAKLKVSQVNKGEEHVVDLLGRKMNSFQTPTALREGAKPRESRRETSILPNLE